MHAADAYFLAGHLLLACVMSPWWTLCLVVGTHLLVGLMHVANAFILHGHFSLTYIGHIVAGGRHTLTNVD